MKLRSQRFSRDPGVNQSIYSEIDLIHKNINEIQKEKSITIKSDYTVTSDDDVILCGIGGITVYVNKNSLSKDKVTIMDISGNASGSNITIKPVAGTKINGSTSSLTISTDYGSIQLFESGGSIYRRIL